MQPALRTMRHRFHLSLLSLLFIALALPAVPAFAQASLGSVQGAEEEVRAVIDQLFDGMRAGDSTAVRSVFHPSATLGSTFTAQDGTPTLASNANGIDRFVGAVGTPHDEVWDERIWDVTILVRDNLAVAWMDYAFFLGDNFSHCGVNAFQLARVAEGWKVVHLMDTRRREGCDVPE